jgi:hypothetical protein
LINTVLTKSHQLRIFSSAATTPTKIIWLSMEGAARSGKSVAEKLDAKMKQKVRIEHQPA